MNEMESTKCVESIYFSNISLNHGYLNKNCLSAFPVVMFYMDPELRAWVVNSVIVKRMSRAYKEIYKHCRI